MDIVWVAYSDAMYYDSHKCSTFGEKVGIYIKGVYSSEVACLRDCLKNNWQCKEYSLIDKKEK